MKERLGFVSNLSSSSFILGYKGSEKERYDLLKEAFVFPENYPIKPEEDTENSFSKVIDNSIRETFSSLEEYFNYEDRECNTDNENKLILDLLKNDFTVSLGSVSDDCGDYLESFLCMCDINYKSDKLVIQKEGGY